MNFKQKLEELGITYYRFSKVSKIPLSTCRGWYLGQMPRKFYIDRIEKVLKRIK